MDFKEFLKDKHSYDAIFVIIDRLKKDSVTVPYHEDLTSGSKPRKIV
jgi:hypothetical protein